MSDVQNIQNTPAMRDKNIRLALAAISNIQKEDIPLLFAALLHKHHRIKLELAMDAAQRMIGQIK